MLMRFHWGLAVGHLYTHSQQCTNASVIWGNINRSFRPQDAPERGADFGHPTDMDHGDLSSDSRTDGSGSDSEDEDYEPSDEHDEEISEGEDADWLDMEEMYGQEGSDDDQYDG
jgi:hypothetical protein